MFIAGWPVRLHRFAELTGHDVTPWSTPPFAPVLERRLVAVTRAGRRPSPAVRAVIEMARLRLAELRSSTGSGRRASS